MAQSRAKALLDSLAEVSGSESGSESDSESGDPAPSVPAAKRQKVAPTVEDLQKAGYKSGPSILYIKPPTEETTDWAWGKGNAAKGDDDEDETYEERQRTREAATTGAEAGARLAMKAAAQAARLREEAAAEKLQMAKERKLTFNDKEKRKRDTGKASRGKNYVEEEKRVARNFGVYSGFD